MMTVKIDFSPENDVGIKKGKYDIYAVVEYNMYEEIEDQLKKLSKHAQEYRVNSTPKDNSQ